MGDYGENIYNFHLKLHDNTYYFDDVCSDASRYRSNTRDHKILKKLLITIIENPVAQYYKLPIFMVIHYLLKYEQLKNTLTYEQFKRFVSNYYAYSVLFVSGSQTKSKASIDKSIFSELYKLNSGESAESVSRNILEATKVLRKDYLERELQIKTFVEEKVYALYSLIDNYCVSDNFISTVYEYPCFNKEHLIAHNNDKLNVFWKEDGNDFTFSLKELLGKFGVKYKASQYKTLTVNYIVLPPDFNASLDIKDIVSKIELIKSYYSQQNRSLPKHIRIVIDNIENISEYSILVSIKGQNKTQEEIKDVYKRFVEKYFDDSNLQALHAALIEGLKLSFRQ